MSNYLSVLIFIFSRKRSATIGSAPTNVGNMLPPSPPMAVGSPICASLPLHKMETNLISPPRNIFPNSMPTNPYTFLSPGSIPQNLSPTAFGTGYHSPPLSASPTFSPSSSPNSIYTRTYGSGDNPAYGRSPGSSGGFGEGFSSGGKASESY